MVLLARLSQWIVLEDRNESQSYQLSARGRIVVLVRMILFHLHPGLLYFIEKPRVLQCKGSSSGQGSQSSSGECVI
jgi:hypothetical protein